MQASNQADLNDAAAGCSCFLVCGFVSVGTLLGIVTIARALVKFIDWAWS